jgi:hypothetical protein
MQERRTNARVRSFLGGKIVFNNRCSSVECLLRNVSPTGARILLSETVTIPEDFELEIPKQGRRVRARLTWRKAEECGVRFLPC